MRRPALIAMLALSVAACGEQAAPSTARSQPQAAQTAPPPMTAQSQPDRPAGQGTPRSRRDGPTYNGKTY